MAGVPGFEPGMAVPKTAALPLGYTPSKRRLLQRVARLYQTSAPKQAHFKGPEALII